MVGVGNGKAAVWVVYSSDGGLGSLHIFAHPRTFWLRL
jgi:hypothetical protein